MPLPSPPGWLKNWRTDPAATILASIILCGVAVGVIQFRSAAQVAQLRAEAARERDEASKRFEAIQAVLVRLGKTAPSDRHSTLVAESGRKAIHEGRWGAGQIYFINAITNEPLNVEHLRTYTQAVLSHERPPEEALDQLGSILQMAACHVAPEDVPAVLARIDEVEKARSRLTGEEPSSTSTAEPPGADGLDAEWVRLKVGPDDLHRDPIRLAGHLRALENFAGTLDEQDRPAADATTAAVAAEIRRWTEIAQAARNVAYVDQCLAKLTDDELARVDNDRAVAIVQAAEAVLPSFWGIRPDALPAELQRTIESYPKTIKNRVDAIGLRKSADLMKQIVDALGNKIDIKTIPGTQGKTIGTIELSCLEIQEQVKRAQVLAAQLPSPDKILEAQKKIESSTQALLRNRNEQYSNYQSEVIRRSNAAFKAYQAAYTVSEAYAITLLEKNELHKVDQTLLTPEVARLYNDVLGKLMSQMGVPALVDKERLMGESSKLKLEEF